MVATATAAALALTLVLIDHPHSTTRTTSSPAGRSAGSAGDGMAHMPSVHQRFALLSAATTDVCQDMGHLQAIVDYMDSLPAGARLQGSCCTPMDMARYRAQIAGLRRYQAIPEIPPDPYDIAAAQAKQMLDYYQSIHLTPTQQAIFDSAAKQTADNGWCCCQCWAWYTHAGLAKYLISQRDFTASQVAAITDLEDCCGGA